MSHPPSPQPTLFHAVSDSNAQLAEKQYTPGVLVAYHSAQPEMLQPLLSGSEEDLLMYSAPHDDLAPIYAAPSDFDSWPLYQQQKGLPGKAFQVKDTGVRSVMGGAHILPAIGRKALQAPMVVRPLRSTSPSTAAGTVVPFVQYNGVQAVHSNTQAVRLPLLNS
jgi:hypothetical protein